MMNRIVLAALLVLGSCPRSSADDKAKSYKLPEEALLIGLPGIEVSWDILPGVLSKLNGDKLSFNSTPGGEICLGSERMLYYPQLAKIVSVQTPIKEFLWLREGNMLVHSGDSLGFLILDPVKGRKKGNGMTRFSSRFKLPYANSRMYPGVGDHFFLVGRNDKESRYEISAWDLSGDTVPAKPLLATAEPITAVAGTPEKVYFASGRTVYELDKGQTKPIYEHQREDIRDLLYRSDVGLFFTTGNSAGYFTKEGPIEFLASPGVEIRFKNKDSLYVRLGPLGNGVLLLSHIDQFTKLRIDPKK